MKSESLVLLCLVFFTFIYPVPSFGACSFPVETFQDPSSQVFIRANLNCVGCASENEPDCTVGSFVSPGDSLLLEIVFENDGGAAFDDVSVHLDLVGTPELVLSGMNNPEWTLSIPANGANLDQIDLSVANWAMHGAILPLSFEIEGLGTDIYTLEASVQVNSLCPAPPETGTWIIDRHCSILGTAIAPEGVEVGQTSGVGLNKILVIGPLGDLQIDLNTFNLTVREGSGVLIKEGGTVRQKPAGN